MTDNATNRFSAAEIRCFSRSCGVLDRGDVSGLHEDCFSGRTVHDNPAVPYDVLPLFPL